MLSSAREHHSPDTHTQSGGWRCWWCTRIVIQGRYTRGRGPTQRSAAGQFLPICGQRWCQHFIQYFSSAARAMDRHAQSIAALYANLRYTLDEQINLIRVNVCCYHVHWTWSVVKDLNSSPEIRELKLHEKQNRCEVFQPEAGEYSRSAGKSFTFLSCLSLTLAELQSLLCVLIWHFQVRNEEEWTQCWAVMMEQEDRRMQVLA